MTRGEDCWSGPCAATINGSARHIEMALKRNIVEERRGIAILLRGLALTERLHNLWGYLKVGQHPKLSPTRLITVIIDLPYVTRLNLLRQRLILPPTLLAT